MDLITSIAHPLPCRPRDRQGKGAGGSDWTEAGVFDGVVPPDGWMRGSGAAYVAVPAATKE